MKAPGNLENKKTRKKVDFHVVRRVHTQFARVGAVFELEAERNHRHSVAPRAMHCARKVCRYFEFMCEIL